MRSALNANTFFATVALARQNTRALILVVEGDDDYFIAKEHVNDQDILLIAGVGGKAAVLDAAEKAERRHVTGVRFIVDVDWDRFTQPTRRYPSNVVPSKHHDAVIDIVMVSAGLVDRVIDSHSRSARRRGVEFDTPTAREDAVKLAAQLAPLRIVNERNTLGLNLAGFPFGRLSTLTPTPDELAQIAVNRSQTTLTASELAATVAGEIAHVGTDQDLLVGDHDFFRALARVLQDRGVTAGADSLWTAFLAGLLCANLGATDWYREIVAWGQSNNRDSFACPCAA